MERIFQNCTFAGNQATAYGKENEPLSVHEYGHMQNAKVNRLGLIVVPELPWLGYSPDGIAIQNGKKILVEVKCPVLGKQMSIAELVKDKILTYSVKNKENLALKCKHAYY